MNTQALVQTHDLGFRYEDPSNPHSAPVLSGVQLSIHPGEKIVVLGRNGSGKSTLFRLLAGAWKPSEGSVSLQGQQYEYNARGRDRIRRAVQLVLQEPDDQLFAMSVFADVSYGPLNQGLDEDTVRERVEETLTQLGIEQLRDRVPHQLSYGQRKRVTLAGALAMRPRLLLLDEPTAGLDPMGSRQLVEVIGDLAASGVAVMLSTHDVNLAYEFAERAVVLHQGHAVSGDVETILGDYALIRSAHLELPWAPLVSQTIGRRVLRAEDLLAR